MHIDQLHPPANEPPRVMQRFIGANILYLLLVHLWILGIPVLGRDLGASARNPLHALIGDAGILYQALNIFLLWLCMLALFFLTRFAVRGPWWLGSLSATLFMANPVKTEALILHSGVLDLLPAVTALASLALYSRHAASPARKYYTGALIFFVLAAASPRNVLLFLVFLLYERLLVPRQSRRYGRLLPLAVVFVVALVMHLGPDQVRGAAANPITSFLPLYLVFYPIGLLPETVHALMDWTPWFWISVATVGVVLVLLYRKARHPAILFAVGSMLVLRLFQGEAFVEPVHLTGGGALLLPAAIFYLGVAAIVRQMIQHPKWAKPLVTITTLLAMAFMGLQVYTIFQWRKAATAVEGFRAEVRAWDEAHPGERAVVAPAWASMGPAPLNFAEAFVAEAGEDRLDAAVALHYAPGMVAEAHTASRNISIRVAGAQPYAAVGWPYTLDRPGESILHRDGLLALVDVTPREYVLQFDPAVPGELGPLITPRNPDGDAP